MISIADQKIKEDLEDFYRRFDTVCEYASQNGDKQFSTEWWERHDEANEKLMAGNRIVEEAKSQSSKELYESFIKTTDILLEEK